eukprot:1192660-Prorocentrum_minimum.AAC.3
MSDKAPENDKSGNKARGKALEAEEAGTNEDKFWLSDGESDGSGMSEEDAPPDFYDSEADDEVYGSTQTSKPLIRPFPTGELVSPPKLARTPKKCRRRKLSIREP